MSTSNLPLSLQIYSLRAIDGLGPQLDLIQSAGYRWVELIGSHLDNAADTKGALDKRGLRASSSHVSIAALRERPAEVMAACKLLNVEQLFMPSVPPQERDSDGPYWSALGAELGILSQRFSQAGIALGYHNHHWELQQKAEGKTALELLFEGAAQTEGKAPLGWQVDVAWLVRGGADPVALMQRYRNRVVSAHAKDLAPAGQKFDEDGWADVGSGILNWTELAAACRANGARFFVAEHDKPNDPARFTRASYSFLSSLKG